MSRFLRWFPLSCVVFSCFAAISFVLFAKLNDAVKRDEAERQRVKESGINVEEYVVVTSTNVKVIHDSRRHVTCWLVNDALTCLPDRDVQR